MTPERRRYRDAAVIIPLLAVFLLAPPVVSLFDRPVVLFGVPLLLVYLFGLWLALIFATLRLSRRLADPEEDDAKEGPEAP